MKIGILTTSYPRYKGDTRGIFIYNLVEALRKDNIDTEVITIKGYESLIGNAGMLPNLAKSWKARFLLIPYTIQLYFKIISKAKACDILHCNWALPAFLAILSKSFHKKKIVLTERSSFLISTNNLFLKPFLSFTYKNVDRLIVISKNSKNILQKKYKLGPTIIPNGLNKPKINTARSTIRKSMGIKPNEKVIIYVGRVDNIKGFNYLFNAFLEVHKKFNDSKLIIIGSGNDLDLYKNNVNKLSLGNSAIFKGSIDHKSVFKYLLASDIFIFPSLNETGGNALLEALSCGLPVITTKVGWAEDVVIEGHNGYFIEKKNVESINEKLTKILTNPALLKKFSKNSLKIANKTIISWNECSSLYEKEYKSLLCQN